MTERSRTPSPNQTRNLERGVFSSLSTLTFIKNLADERKTQSVSTTQIRTNGTIKPKSPIQSRPNTSPSAAKVQRIERPKTPETGRHSPLRVQNGNSKIKEEPRKVNEDEINKLQDVIKKLTNQLVKEKKQTGKIEAELRDFKQNKKMEMAQTQANIEKLQKTMQAMKASQKAIQSEKEKAQKDFEKSKDLADIMTTQIKSLADALVLVLGTMMSSTVGNEEDEEEKLKIAEQIQKLVSDKLNSVMALTHVDLNTQLQEVKSWAKYNNMPRQITKEHVYKSDMGSFSYLQEEEETPAISYTVEYFEDSGSSKNSSQGFSHPFKPLKGFENEENDLKHTGSLSERIINKIRGEEVSFNEKECAVALYDFDGERDGDLSFSRGDVIEVLQKNDSGWWVGKMGSHVGSFPYNFIQQV